MPNEALEAELEKYVGQEIGAPEVGPDPVNRAMIRHWCEVIGDENPVYTDDEAAARSVHGGIVAPPTMLQAWILPGLAMATADSGPPQNKQRELHALLSAHGYSSVVATNCEQEYARYLRPGDRICGRTVVEAISEEKATALGVGYFIHTRTRFFDQDGEEVGWMTFRVLKFKPSQPPQALETRGGAPARPTRIRPPRGHDNAWWWEGVDAGEILIQKCSDCGKLRHPPRPMCGACNSTRWESVASKGAGCVHSYVVMHHPQIPGYEFPLAVALIDLDEGTRIVSNVVDCDPEDVHIGMRVQGFVEQVDDDFKLPLFRPAR